jgi:hypothetical protein
VLILKKRKKEVGIFPTFLVTGWGRRPICVGYGLADVAPNIR